MRMFRFCNSTRWRDNEVVKSERSIISISKRMNSIYIYIYIIYIKKVNSTRN